MRRYLERYQKTDHPRRLRRATEESAVDAKGTTAMRYRDLVIQVASGRVRTNCIGEGQVAVGH